MKTRGCQNREIRGRGGRWSSLSSSYIIAHRLPPEFAEHTSSSLTYMTLRNRN